MWTIIIKRDVAIEILEDLGLKGLWLDKFKIIRMFFLLWKRLLVMNRLQLMNIFLMCLNI